MLTLLFATSLAAAAAAGPTLRCNVSAVELHHYTQPDRPPYVTRIVRKSRFAALERTRERTFCILTPLVLTITNPYQWVDCAVCPSQKELNDALLNEAKQQFEREMAEHDAELSLRTERAINQWYKYAVFLPLRITVPVLLMISLILICELTKQQQQQHVCIHASGGGRRNLNEIYVV